MVINMTTDVTPKTSRRATAERRRAATLQSEAKQLDTTADRIAANSAAIDLRISETESRLASARAASQASQTPVTETASVRAQAQADVDSIEDQIRKLEEQRVDAYNTLIDACTAEVDAIDAQTTEDATVAGLELKLNELNLRKATDASNSAVQVSQIRRNASAKRAQAAQLISTAATRDAKKARR